MTTVSAEELANQITDAFFEAPTPEGIANFITSEYFLVPRDPETAVDFESRTVRVNGANEHVPQFMHTERILRKVVYDLTALEAIKTIEHHENAVEIERLAMVLHSISDATLDDCRAQAKEMYDLGARFIPTPINPQQGKVVAVDGFENM